MDSTGRDVWVIAARCRDCSAATWEVNLVHGRRRIDPVEHARSCSEPAGRLDLAEFADVVGATLSGLESPMSDADITSAIQDLQNQWTT